jgi:hypothetical protein
MNLENKIEKIRKQTEPAKAKEIKAITDAAAANKQLVTDSYNAQIADTNESYEGLFRKNAVQKVLNERDLERRAAEMGLTDSGLSRTQMTANQLSYANQNAEYRRARQKAVDTLATAMRSKNAEIDIKANNDIANVNAAYEKNAIEQGTSAYNSDLDRENEFAIAKYESDNKKEVDLAKTAVNKTSADTAKIKAQNEAIKLSNQAAQDEANTKKEAFNDLYGSIVAEYKVNKNPSKVHLSMIKDYQDENGLDSDSLEIKRLLSAAHITAETYDIYSDTRYIPAKTDKAEEFLNGLKSLRLWDDRNKPKFESSVTDLMDKYGLEPGEILWVSKKLGFI